jgi:hypothetical protein
MNSQGNRWVHIDSGYTLLKRLSDEVSKVICQFLHRANSK